MIPACLLMKSWDDFNTPTSRDDIHSRTTLQKTGLKGIALKVDLSMA